MVQRKLAADRGRDSRWLWLDNPTDHTRRERVALALALLVRTPPRIAPGGVRTRMDRGGGWLGL